MVTLEHTLHVQVSDEANVVQTYPCPNPFGQATYFTYVLSAVVGVEAVRIRIYAIAGRKIRGLDVPIHTIRAGFNQAYRDGRDEDGDEVANGYYFYEIFPE